MTFERHNPHWPDRFPITDTVCGAVISRWPERLLMLLMDDNTRVGSFSYEGRGKCLYWSDAQGKSIAVSSLIEAVGLAELEIQNRRNE